MKKDRMGCCCLQDHLFGFYHFRNGIVFIPIIPYRRFWEVRKQNSRLFVLLLLSSIHKGTPTIHAHDVDSRDITISTE